MEKGNTENFKGFYYKGENEATMPQENKIRRGFQRNYQKK